MDKIDILFLIGREGVIASGAADDAICLFVESKEQVACYISLSPYICICLCTCACVYVCFFKDQSPFWYLYFTQNVYSLPCTLNVFKMVLVHCDFVYFHLCCLYVTMSETRMKMKIIWGCTSLMGSEDEMRKICIVHAMTVMSISKRENKNEKYGKV